MKNSYKSLLLWSSLAIICIFLLSRPVYAEEIVNGWNGGPGVVLNEDGSIIAKEMEDVTVSAETTESNSTDIPASNEDVKSGETEGRELKSAEEEKAAEAVASAETDSTVYTHDDIRYVKGDSWGDHKLTGYSREKNGDELYSGRKARAKHTIAASSELPIGTVLIVEGIKGPNASDYNGIYVVEDRGGKAIEDGMLDIFFETHKEAQAVTHKGWNTARVWIAKKVD